jgi:hypothetical protein
VSWYVQTMTMTQRVREVLSDDLLKPEYRRLTNRKPTTGHCYAASEALYHLLGPAGFTPQNIRHEGASHWYLKADDGAILDPTADQFDTPVPYEAGRGKGFLTKQPSKRALEIIRRVA